MIFIVLTYSCFFALYRTCRCFSLCPFAPIMSSIIDRNYNSCNKIIASLVAEVFTADATGPIFNITLFHTCGFNALCMRYIFVSADICTASVALAVNRLCILMIERSDILCICMTCIILTGIGSYAFLCTGGLFSNL